MKTRGAIVDPRLEDVSAWSTAARMERYTPEAIRLATAAAQSALSGVDIDRIGLFVMVSCTGYSTPGADVEVARALDLPADVRRLFLGHMGCHASLPAIDLATDYVRTKGKAALLVSVELPSLHLQPADDDVEQFVAHALFGDAAAAVVLQPDVQTPALRVIDSESVSLPHAADLMTWRITDRGFRMGLSSRLPETLEAVVRPVVERLLQRQDLSVDAVSRWAVHPGGPRILDVVENQLALTSDALDTSRQVLADVGNCSSATVLMVLQRMQPSLGVGDHVVALAFGPGLTVYATLLTVSG